MGGSSSRLEPLHHGAVILRPTFRLTSTCGLVCLEPLHHGAVILSPSRYRCAIATHPRQVARRNQCPPFLLVLADLAKLIYYVGVSPSLAGSVSEVNHELV